MSELISLNAPRLMDGDANDPAAFLLRSARADKAPAGAKDRARAILGLSEPNIETKIPALPKRNSYQRAKRSRAIAPFVPFQNLIAAPRPISMRKTGAAIVVSVQIAAMIAAVCIRPTPRDIAVSRPDEPEMVFWASNKMAQSSIPASNSEKSSSSTPIDFQPGMIPPVRICGIDPSYPKSAMLYGVTGTVVVQCVVTEEGLTSDCEIVKSPAYLDKAVLEAVRTWRFEPVKWHGRPVPVRYVFKYNFKLG